ncbi:type II secretion system F family protein [uncultured Sphingomonas sp.]|uniref:type II secretion system F family protein n=1 Tax=uncultured Sphingomonas sp. TaxID=158754 RepID=UPI0025DADE02|nr:type II secretion system F family protein [uncultured Sphingomonas sp.]
MEPASLMMICAGALVVVLMIAFAVAGPSPARAQARRMTAVRDRHMDLTGAGAVEARVRKIDNSKSSQMDATVGRLLPNPELLQKRLSMTGRDWTVGQYGMATAGAVVGVAILFLILGMPLLLALFVGLFAGVGLPHMIVGSLINRRVAKFTAKFPDAIELLVRGLRSGLPITETMGVVGVEVEGPVGDEFRSVADKMKIGKTMDQALQETSDRLGTPEFQFFVITIAIQRETGGNLAETLANLADVLRKRGQMKLKIKAMSSESKASAYIIGALPFIVFGLIWFINGSYMQNFFVDQRLILTGLGGLVWMSIGAFIMRQMINFEI